MIRLSEALVLLALAALGGFFGGLALGLRHTPKAPPAQVLVVGGGRQTAGQDLSAQDQRPAARRAARTVVTAPVLPGEPTPPPVPDAPRPSWTTDWTLRLPQDRPCLSPSLHVATSLRLEGNQVVADSTGWAECEGQPLAFGGVRQVERRTELRLPMPARHPWRAALLWAPPQRSEAKQWAVITTYDFAPRTFVGAWAFSDRQGLALGFSW